MRTAARMGEQSLGEVVAALSGEAPAPAAGSAVAATLAIAAGLVAKCARKAAGRVDGAEATVERAEAWQRRALELADDDAARYGEVLEARRSGSGREALAAAADPPLEIAALAVEVAVAAADLAADGKPSLRGDAHAAALLAESASRSAAALAAIDLAEAGVKDDERVERTRSLPTAAEQARSRAEAAAAVSGR